MLSFTRLLVVFTMICLINYIENNKMGNFSIKVTDSSGYPKSGVKVSVFFGIMYGNDKAYTNSDGWVTFTNLDGNVTSANVYVNGEDKGNIRTYSNDTHSFTI